ncbi:MAG: LPXTG cell wall anchor domain-containing protein, partial [Culicoidibacterales bacterium]
AEVTKPAGPAEETTNTNGSKLPATGTEIKEIIIGSTAITLLATALAISGRKYRNKIARK